MATTNTGSGVLPGMVSVPPSKMKTPAPASNGAAMPKGIISPFISGKK